MLNAAKLSFVTKPYQNFTKFTHISWYNGHNVIQFMTFMESYNIMITQVINCTIFELFETVLTSVCVCMVHFMTFMSSYTTISNSLWVQCFWWRSTREVRTSKIRFVWFPLRFSESCIYWPRNRRLPKRFEKVKNWNQKFDSERKSVLIFSGSRKSIFQRWTVALQQCSENFRHCTSLNRSI